MLSYDIGDTLRNNEPSEKPSVCRDKSEDLPLPHILQSLREYGHVNNQAKTIYIVSVSFYISRVRSAACGIFFCPDAS